MTAEELKAKIDGRLVVASVSGGKDSAAMCLHLQELDIPHERVFMDTGWENERTYEYLRGTLTEKLGPIQELRGKFDMVRLIRKKAMFPSRLRRYCTEELKFFPIRDYLSGLDEEPINTVGIRAGESKARAKMPEWEFSKELDCDVWRPIHKWTQQQVIDIHTRHELRPNPLYLKGASRVGCWPCIFARKAEIRFIADEDPERIDLLEQLELELSEKAGAPRSFFHAKTTDVRPLWPIREVVEWSRTSFGGKQFEFLAAGDSEAGCMRWGLCETNSDDLS